MGYEINILPFFEQPVDAMRLSGAVAYYIMREGVALMEDDSVIINGSHSTPIKFTHGADGEKIAIATVAFRRTE